jgi:ATP-dependent DNA helicase 2 subunit 2
MNLDKVGKNYLVPEENHNPFIWRMNKAIKARALDPNAPIPDFKDSFKAQFEVAPQLREAADDIAAQIAKHYNVRKVIPKENKKMVIVEDMVNNPTRPMDDILGDIDQGNGEDVQMLSAPDIDFGTQDETVEISEDTPVKDFRALLAKPSQFDPVEYATKEMRRIIMLLLEKNFGTNSFKKVIDCLTVLREVGVKVSS